MLLTKQVLPVYLILDLRHFQHLHPYTGISLTHSKICSTFSFLSGNRNEHVSYPAEFSNSRERQLEICGAVNSAVFQRKFEMKKKVEVGDHLRYFRFFRNSVSPYTAVERFLFQLASQATSPIKDGGSPNARDVKTKAERFLWQQKVIQPLPSNAEK